MVERDATSSQPEAAMRAIRHAIAADALRGVYLYGSAVSGGLRPDSDLDLFVLADRPLMLGERRALIAGLRPISRRRLRPEGWRPLEVTVVARPDLEPWRYPPRFELQYGEWLDDSELDAQAAAAPTTSADLAIVLAMVRDGGRALSGAAASEALGRVPPDALLRATVDAIDPLLADLQDDTRNVLLTLARMWSTVATGEFRTKDAAADWALARLEPERRPLLERARDLYRDGGWGTWDADGPSVRALARLLVEAVRSGRRLS